MLDVRLPLKITLAILRDPSDDGKNGVTFGSQENQYISHVRVHTNAVVTFGPPIGSLHQHVHLGRSISKNAADLCFCRPQDRTKSYGVRMGWDILAHRNATDSDAVDATNDAAAERGTGGTS